MTQKTALPATALVKSGLIEQTHSAIRHPSRYGSTAMVIFYGRWLKNTNRGVQQTQVIVQDERENGGNIAVITIRDGNYLTREAKTEAEAMHLVGDICIRLGGGQ